VHTYELTPNSAAAAAGKVWRRRQPNFGRRGSARRRASRIWLVRASRKTDGGAAEGSMVCWAVWYGFCCKFLGEYNRERILKIGQHLSKL